MVSGPGEYRGSVLTYLMLDFSSVISPFGNGNIKPECSHAGYVLKGKRLILPAQTDLQLKTLFNAGYTQ